MRKCCISEQSANPWGIRIQAAVYATPRSEPTTQVRPHSLLADREHLSFTKFLQEQWRTKEPRLAMRTMPTDLERTGDFSRSLNADGGLRTIYDPWTTKVDTATNTASRLPFPGNVIPTNRTDRTSAKFMQDFWKPNNAGDNITGINNFNES